jgi:transcriptional regulator GlxA family with amidase domain
VALADVAPRLASALEQQLNDVSTWDACFDLLDDAFLATTSERVALAPSVQAAWALLAASHGTIAVETLARSVGSSSRHLSHQFRHALGISPKEVARVMRFERAQELLRSRPGQTIASVAARCGYADQAHMTRDWHAFTGSSPGRWRRQELRFVQDELSSVVQTR